MLKFVFFSPALNPIEFLFHQVKLFIKKYENRMRLDGKTNLQILTAAFESIKRDTFLQTILASIRDFSLSF
jgi:hypothetical protein